MPLLDGTNPLPHPLRDFFRWKGVTLRQIAMVMQKQGITMSESYASLYLRNRVETKPDVEKVLYQLAQELGHDQCSTVATPDGRNTKGQQSEEKSKKPGSPRSNGEKNLPRLSASSSARNHRGPRLINRKTA